MSPREKKPVDAPDAPVGEQMQVTLRGPAEKVMERLGDKRDGDNGAPKVEPESDDVELAKALSDPQNAVVVRRISPRIGLNNERLNVEIWNEACPLTMHDIMEEIQTNHGGRKYRVAVVNMETRKTIAARRVEVDADPIVPGPDPDDERARQALIDGMNPQPTPDEITAESLDREAQLLAKQAAVERQKQALDDIRGRKQALPPVPTGKDPEVVALKAQLEAMEKRNAELAYQSKLDIMQRELDALKSRPPANPDAGVQKLLLDYMQKSDERFNKLIETMQSQKLDQIARELSALKNAPNQQGNTVVEKIVERALDNLLGDEGEEGDDDDKPWYERLADKYLPEVFDLIKEKERGGKPMSRDEVIAQINSAADRAVAEEKAKLAALQQQRQPPALPAPQPAPSQPASNPAPAPSPVPSPSPGTETAPERKLPSLEDEIKIRAAGVMAVLEREMALRTRDWEWSAIAWRSLPEDLLGKLAAAPTATDFLDCFNGLVNPDGIAMLKGKLAADQRLVAWFQRGIDELKEWWGKLQKDPNFDPDDEPEEE